MHETIHQRDDAGGIGKHLGPLCEWFVRCDQCATGLVSAADQFKQQIGMTVGIGEWNKPGARNLHHSLASRRHKVAPHTKRTLGCPMERWHMVCRPHFDRPEIGDQKLSPRFVPLSVVNPSTRPRCVTVLIVLKDDLPRIVPRRIIGIYRRQASPLGGKTILRTARPNLPLPCPHLPKGIAHSIQCVGVSADRAPSANDVYLVCNYYEALLFGNNSKYATPHALINRVYVKVN